jgi:hypothetical protein
MRPGNIKEAEMSDRQSWGEETALRAGDVAAIGLIDVD